MHVRGLLLACVVLAMVVAISPRLFAQAGTRVSGRLVNSLSGDPIAGATVTLEELKREAASAADGTFTFENVPPGSYHLAVRAQGYSSRRTEVAASDGSKPVDVTVDPELHFEEVLSVSPEARSQFESFQPTSVLAGQERIAAERGVPEGYILGAAGGEGIGVELVGGEELGGVPGVRSGAFGVGA